MILLIAVLIGWLIERNDRRNSGRASGGWAVISLALRVAVCFGLGGRFVILSQIVQAAGTSTEARQMVFQWGALAAGLVPVLIGFTGAPLMQTRRSGGLAMGGAAVAWLGTPVGHVVATILLPVLKPEAPNPEGIGTSLVLLIVLSVAGFALASLGGLLGWGPRALAET